MHFLAVAVTSWAIYRTDVWLFHFGSYRRKARGIQLTMSTEYIHSSNFFLRHKEWAPHWSEMDMSRQYLQWASGPLWDARVSCNMGEVQFFGISRSRGVREDWWYYVLMKNRPAVNSIAIVLVLRMNWPSIFMLRFFFFLILYGVELVFIRAHCSDCTFRTRKLAFQYRWVSWALRVLDITSQILNGQLETAFDVAGKLTVTTGGLMAACVHLTVLWCGA